MNYKSKIKTVADAFKYCKKELLTISEFSKFPEEMRDYLYACYILPIIIAALNAEANGGKEWIPDYTDNNWKYELLFGIEADKKRPSGFGLSAADFGRWITITSCGSRLQFINKEVAMYCFENKNFNKHWKDYILYKK